MKSPRKDFVLRGLKMFQEKCSFIQKSEKTTKKLKRMDILQKKKIIRNYTFKEKNILK